MTKSENENFPTLESHETPLAQLDEKSTDKPCTVGELYQFATTFDYILMTFGTLGAMAAGFCQPCFCLIFGSALDSLNGADIQTQINKLALYLLYLGLGNVVAATIQTACWVITGERQAQKFREAYVNAVLSQEIGWFDTVGAGQLATKLADLSGQMRDGMTYKTSEFIQFLSQVIGAVLVGLALDPYVALIMFACTPLIGGAATFWVKAISSATQGSSEQYAQAGGVANESLSSIRTVSALNAQPEMIGKYRTHIIHAMRIGINKGLRVGISLGALWFIVLCTYAVTLWYGSTQIADTLKYHYTDWPRSQTGGKVYSAFFACLMGAFGVGQLAPPVSSFTSARVAAGKFLATIRRVPKIDGLSQKGLIPSHKHAAELAAQSNKAVDTPIPESAQEVGSESQPSPESAQVIPVPVPVTLKEGEAYRPKGQVELRDIVFAYPSRPEIDVCKGYNLTIPAGQSCALVGASGSGKSTVINLLLRFYDPNHGQVTLDGMDIKELNIRWLRSQIGYVGQEPVLFSGTIAENIAYGLDASFAPEISVLESHTSTEYEKEKARDLLQSRVEEAAKLANAHEFISDLPEGYHTDVGSSGSSMSGGQKQRIAIARALIKRPAVLLLDEATSALDATSERMVQASIDALSQGHQQTTIIIAHRLSTIRGADKIAVVSQGVIAEEGTHDSLMEKDGLYADLVKLQVQDIENDPNNPNNKSADSKLSPKSAQLTAAADTSSPTSRSSKSAKVLEDKKTERIELSKEQTTQLTRKMWNMIYAHFNWFAVSILGASMVGALFPLWGLILGKSLAVMFNYNESELRKNAAIQAGYFVAIAVNAGIGGILQNWGVAQVGEKIVMKLRSDQFQAVIRREIAFFDRKENSVGEITSRLSDDARTLTKATGQAAAQQFQAYACLVIGLIIGFVFCWKIGLVVLGCLVPMIVAGGVKSAAYSGQLVRLIFKEKDNSNETEKGLIATAFTQMRTVSAFSAQFKVAKLYNSITYQKMMDYNRSAWIVGIAKGTAEFTTNCTFSVLFFYSGYLLVDMDFTFEEVMVSILSLMFASFGLGQAMADLGDINEGLQAAARIFKVIEDGESSSIDGLSLTGMIPSAEPTSESKESFSSSQVVPYRSKGRIELVDVFFRYPSRPDMEVCKGYTLTIEPGEMVALVGPSGSGKSTLMNLLMRFYDPCDPLEDDNEDEVIGVAGDVENAPRNKDRGGGKVLFDGVDVRDLNVRWLRSQIGYVGQEPVLFKGSVADNIARGRAITGMQSVKSLSEALKEEKMNSTAHKKLVPVPAKADPASTTEKDVEMGTLNNTSDSPTGFADVDPDIVEAARASHAHEFICSFPNGYHTEVGESSSLMVSGGQKQRIAIARALIKRPAVLLLDEATSALDATSEKLVQESIDALQQSKSQTTIVIAHRLTTIKNADKIAVIEGGRVVELGNHEELLSKGGLYADLWYKQVGAGNKSS